MHNRKKYDMLKHYRYRTDDNLDIIYDLYNRYVTLTDKKKLKK